MDKNVTNGFLTGLFNNETMDNQTVSSTAQTEMTLHEFQKYSRFLFHVNLYFTPVIIIVGLLGNITSFFVFVTTSLRHLSSSVYLAALALADSGFLFQVKCS